MAKGLGNNPLQNGGADTLIRSTEAISVRTELPQAQQAPSARLVAKSMQLDSLLNERLRRCAYESRTKEAQIIREALHEYLAKKGY